MSIRPRKKIALQISLNKAYQVIQNPLVTEKSTQQSEFNKMVFSVPVNATKLEVKSSIEKIFSVKVKTVNTILLKGKVKRFKGVLGRRSNTKKAIVTLAPGNTIDLSAGV
jgi:large subunit ribosomal protein L23